MIFFSIVNHNHDDLIVNNKDLIEISKKYQVYIKSNTPASNNLIIFCQKNNIQLLNESFKLGFGENNNFIFDYLNQNNIINDNDYFLVINPDVKITIKEMEKLESEITSIQSDIFTINLYRDQEYTIYDQSIKKFPKLYYPILSFLKIKRQDNYNKDKIKKPITIDWASGSFLLFKTKTYKELNGFDQKYFMYFEDVDICKRAHDKKMPLTYLPNIKAVHLGAFKNRDITSKHFLWYISSLTLYYINRIFIKKSINKKH